MILYFPIAELHRLMMENLEDVKLKYDIDPMDKAFGNFYCGKQDFSCDQYRRAKQQWMSTRPEHLYHTEFFTYLWGSRWKWVIYADLYLYLWAIYLFNSSIS